MLTLPHGTTIRTEPQEFIPDELKLELAKLRALTPKLDPRWQQEFRALPRALQEEVHAVKFLTAPTPSGLERVDGILWNAYILEGLLEQLLRGESIRSDVATVLGLSDSESPTVSGSTLNRVEVAVAPQLAQRVDQPPEGLTVPTPRTSAALATLTIPTESSPRSATEPRGGTLVLPSEIE
jgi:hypothetical protein